MCEYYNTVGYAKFSVTKGWCLEGALKSREMIYGSLTYTERGVSDINMFQPEDFGYGVCYLSVGQFL